MGNVVELDCITTLDISADRVLSAALEEDLAGVVLVGYKKDGSEFFRSSYADGGTILWLFEKCKKQLLEMWN
ncbi:hypothetical protein LCGC14_0610580 [marine sediment metagenome]|uniref:Uncharacterized protein n=1 Tax=marine sediment metagenome TaxID=412755 RepID=A0A0F9RCL1_9ZZZZ